MSKPNDWEEFYNLYTIAAQTSMDGSFTTIKYTARARFFVTDAKVWLQFLALFIHLVSVTMRLEGGSLKLEGGLVGVREYGRAGKEVSDGGTLSRWHSPNSPSLTFPSDRWHKLALVCWCYII